MYAINAVYDGNLFKPQEPVPVNGKYEVVITFTKPINEAKNNILKYFGTWDNDDVKAIDGVINERGNFSMNRMEI
jgi:predicted DNA-binding antitoxin AbrB/MazE fold protein